MLLIFAYNFELKTDDDVTAEKPETDTRQFEQPSADQFFGDQTTTNWSSDLAPDPS